MRFIILLFVSVLLVATISAEEENYRYNFNLDTTITGQIVAEGNIFPDKNYTYILQYIDNRHVKSSKIEFLDENYSAIETFLFPSKGVLIHKTPLVFDFDGDSFDEVVFVFYDSSKVWLEYYDPSNTPQVRTKIFEMPIRQATRSRIFSITKAQLDSDKMLEIILSIGASSYSKYSISGLWAIDIAEEKTIWEKPSAEKIYSNMIYINKGELPSLIYSGSGSNSNTESLSFSQGHYFFQSKKKGNFIYDINYVENNKLVLDTTSQDYSTSSKAFIRAVDKNQGLLWEKYINGKAITTKLDTMHIGGNLRLLLSSYCRQALNKTESLLEIINPFSGKVEKRKIFNEKIRHMFLANNRAIVSFNKKKMFILDNSLNIIDSAHTESYFTPISTLKLDGENVFVIRDGVTIIQKIILFNKELKKQALLKASGVAYVSKKNNFISVFDRLKTTSKIYSLSYVPWYNRISTKVLRTIAISVLLSIVIIMLMWIATLRVSSNKIKRQKNELEATNKELKATTSKLIQAEKLAVYGTIASSIAHEINSPLGAIINSAQRIKENKNANIEQNINLIERAGKRAKVIIEKLLIGIRNYNDEAKANLVDVIAEWIEISDKQFKNLGIVINLEVNCNPELAISSTELNQIFTNILFNARDSIMERKGEHKSITIKAHDYNEHCKIIISDTGTGFSTTKLEKPFEAFITTKEKGKGTGLGLWVVKSIIDNIDGKISIRNYEMGAEVELIIPLYTEIENG